MILNLKMYSSNKKMILYLTLFTILSLTQACDFPCLRTCESLGNGPSCYKVCDCIQSNHGVIQEFSMGWEDGHLVISNVTDSERQWIENILGCNIDCAQNCVQNYMGDFLLYCMDQCGCKQFVPPPTPQKALAFSSDSNSILKSIDETDCINLCTEICSSKVSNLNSCLQLCLSENCAYTLSESGISSLSVLMIFSVCVGVIYVMRHMKKRPETFNYSQPLLSNP